MAANLSVVVGCDNTGFIKSVEEAKKTLQKYKEEAKNASSEIGKNVSVTKEQVASYERVVKALNKVSSGTLTTSQLSKALSTLVRELKIQWANLSEEAKNSDFGKSVSHSLKTAQDQLKLLNNQLELTKDNILKVGNVSKSAGGDVTSLKDNLGLLSHAAIGIDLTKFTKLGVAVAGVGLFAELVAKSTKLTVEFEDALSNLSAITGMQGENLDKLKRLIMETGNATSTAFTTIADSYTLIGSKMPELLKQPEALDAVTRAVITLSKASRMDLESATNSLTGIMNQMGAKANEASVYINVLAAGAKEGAGDIKYLATAFDKCGTSASAAGLSVQLTTALIEILALKIPDASTAGTNLRNILLKMMTATDEYNPKVVGLTTALENLSKKTNDTTFMTKMFGAENVNAAITLAQSTEKAKELTAAVSDTNEAEKQAETQTNNVAGSLRKLNTDWNNFITSLNNSTGTLNKIILKLDALVQLMQYASLGLDERSLQDIGNAADKNAAIAKMKERIALYDREIANKTKMILDYESGSFKYAHLNAEAKKKNIEILKQQRAELQKQKQDYEKAANAKINPPKNNTTKTTTATTTKKAGGGSGTGSGKSSKTTRTKTEAERLREQLNNRMDDAMYKIGARAMGTAHGIDTKETTLPELEQKVKLTYDENGEFVNPLKDTEKLFNVDTGSIGRDWNTSDVLAYNSAIAKQAEQEAYLNEVLGQSASITDNFQSNLNSISDIFSSFNQMTATGVSSINKFAAGTDATGKSLLMMGSLAMQAGEAFDSKELSVAGIIAQGIGTVALSFAQALQTAQPWPVWLAFGATGLATMLTMITLIKSATSGYASGGIVAGNTHVGDYLMARLNGGEIVMNGTLQQRLWNIINGSETYNAKTAAGGNVEFTLLGEDLYGALTNYSKANPYVKF